MTGPDEAVGNLSAAELETLADLKDPVIQTELLAAIVESSDDAIISKSLDRGIMLSWNPGATRIFGYEAHEVIGRPVTLIIPPELHDEERQIMTRLRRGERIDHFDTTRLTRDGRRIAVSLTVSPIRDARGVLIAASKVARDISGRKEAEQILREREMALYEADRRKNEFMAALAHELRNMLAPIGYAIAAGRKARATADPAQKRADEVIGRQTGHMSRLVDDLMDISRVTRGIFELRRETVELMPILESAIEIARPALNAGRHRLGVESPDTPMRLAADASRLVQVFSNLLINAARYTHPGGDIRVRVWSEGGEVLVSVRDNGMGIAPELMPHIFNLYSRGRTDLRGVGGLGIGLALVRAIVLLHGGRVTAESEGPGKGSEFLVVLPVAQRPPLRHETDPEHPVPGRRLRILVADDNHDAADMCARLLGLAGHRVHTAYTGREALALAQSVRPDAVMVDLSLPDADGCELARQVRASDWGRQVALIATTGWSQEEDRQRALAAGFDHHLVKPIDLKVLESVLQHLGTEEARASRGTPAPACAGP